MNNPETQPLWLRHRKNVTAGWISLGAMTGCLIWQYNRAENGQSQVVPAVGVVASAIAVVAFSAISFNYQKRAILRYNKQFDKGSFNLGMTQNGVGWVMTF